MEHQEAIDTLASERYILGEMSEAERDSFEEHFLSCQVCADDVLVADRMRTGVRDGLLKAARVTPAAIPKRSRGLAIAIPWAAAAMMTLVAGYESFHAVGPGGAGALNTPIALAPMTLRAATRGEELTIDAKPGSAVTLAVDLGGARFGHALRYEIRNEGGDLLGSGNADTPTSGAPLLLLIPSSVFGTSGRCVLTLRDSAGAEPREYRFIVRAG
jgi:Putative zinc-finger